MSTVSDTGGPIAPRVQTALDAALARETELTGLVYPGAG